MHGFHIAYLVLAAAFVTAGPVCFGQQRVFSYLDENGVRVFTNIPPKNAAAGNAQNPVTYEKATTRPTNGADVRANVDSIIEKYAGQYELDPKLVRSMIASESAFNPRALSRKGAQGLMQLMPETASRVGVKNPYDPEENIRGGMEHMRFLLNTFNNDLTLSLAAYNAGENLVQRIRRVPNFPETKAYVRTVTSKYGRAELQAQASQGAPRGPSTFKWVDNQGITHLTNIAPAQRHDSPLNSIGTDAQSSQ